MNERQYLENQIHFLVELLTEDQWEEYILFLKRFSNEDN